MTDEPDTAELENRIDKLESTIEKMMPSRRDALKMGGAALVGGAAMSGTASAGTNQVGTIGSQASPVDLESEDINNADTVTTQDLVVNGTATGVAQDLQGCRVFLGSNQNISANVRTKVQFDNLIYDNGGNFDTSTHDFTCPKTGLYLANVQCVFTGGGNGQIREVMIGSGAGSFLTDEGSVNSSADSHTDRRAATTTVNKYTQGDTISAYANNKDSSDTILNGNHNGEKGREVAFLGSL